MGKVVISQDGLDLSLGSILLELAYLGGLFDGEGFTSFRSTGLVVGVHMGDLEPLEVMCRHFGNNIRAVPGRGNRKPSYELRYSGNKARRVLTALLPYLRCKKTRVELTLEYYQNWFSLSTTGKRNLIEKFDNEPLVIKYRKRLATGRPKGAKANHHHAVIKKGYGGRNNPFLISVGSF